MNATGGMRRVALVLGFMGCIGGALTELSFAAEVADISQAGGAAVHSRLRFGHGVAVIGFLFPWAVVRALTWALNARGGMRRVALVLGFVGCTVGLLAERTSGVFIWNRVAAHRRYLKLMALPFMTELVPRLSPHSINVLPDGMPYGIKTVGVFEPREISIELFTGQVESGYHGEPPSISDIALLTVWPLIGFLLPWGLTRAMIWVVTWVR
jgi:hypothetical protein